MKENKNLFNQLGLLTTEKRNKSSLEIDKFPTEKILTIINKEDQKIPKLVSKEINHISKAVGLVVKSLTIGGRLIYVGAGTSGRLGVLDAAEIPPTFGANPDLVQAIIAGGKKAVFRSQEGAEDREDEAVKKLQDLKISQKDVVCGIAASLRTPFVIAALSYAKKKNCKTVIVTTNPKKVLNNKSFAQLKKTIDVAICVDVGPEVVMGSTRMKSGTAQKLVLNMITTTTMIRLGKVYGNMMIDFKMNSRKLKERAKRVIMIVTGVDYDVAENILKEADGHVKTAIVMIMKNTDKKEAQRRLKASKGFVRKALEIK